VQVSSIFVLPLFSTPQHTASSGLLDMLAMALCTLLTGGEGFSDALTLPPVLD